MPGKSVSLKEGQSSLDRNALLLGPTGSSMKLCEVCSAIISVSYVGVEMKKWAHAYAGGQDFLQACG